jgi:HEAT repeat protein
MSRLVPAGDDYAGWVDQLAVNRRRQLAKQHLLRTGAVAVPAIRRGLAHSSPAARRACVSLLDFLLDADAIPDLVHALDDDDAEVVRRALHALACDQCKQGECRPGDELWVARGVELLSSPDPDVRAGAIDALGKLALRRGDVGAALAAAADRELDAGLREMARRASRV